MDMSPVDMVRVAHIIEDNAGRYFAHPMIGCSRESVTRYVTEGPLSRLCERRGWDWRELCRWVAAYLDEHPELLDTPYSDAQIREREEARKAAARDFERRASAAFRAGDYELTLTLLDEGELVAPDGCPQVRGGPPVTWESLRELVRERAAEARVG